jgi:hypothetical protein
MVILTPIERETLQVFFLHISQMLNVSTVANMADISAIVHLVPHACQHITVDGHTCYYCLLAANQGNYVRELFLKKTWKVSLSIGVRNTMICWVAYLLLILKWFTDLWITLYREQHHIGCFTKSVYDKGEGEDKSKDKDHPRTNHEDPEGE